MKAIFFISIITISFSYKTRANDEEKYQNIFNDVCQILNIDTSKIHIEAENGGLADCLNQLDGTATIHFNIKEFRNKPIVNFVGVLCHELGHFKHRDLVARSPIIEGTADEFAGYAMRKLGYDLTNSQVYLKIYVTNDPGYPTSIQRIALVQKGWNKLNQELFDLQSLNQITPKVTWEISNNYQLQVNIGERKVVYPIIRTRDVLLIYDSLTNCTIQLLNFENKIRSTGLGRVINSQGFYTYFRFKGRFFNRNYYQIYYKGKLKNLDETSKENTFDGQDLIVSCRDRDLGIKIELRLLDYNLSPFMYAMPATYN